MLARACPICSSNSQQRLYHNVCAPLDGVDMSYSVGACNGCGFIFAYELPVNATYAAYYSTASKYDTSGSVSDTDLFRYQAIATMCASFVARDALVVDVGCGSGALLNILKLFGYSQLRGVDPAPLAGKLAKEKYGLNHVYLGFFANASTEVPIDDADLILLTAVLEHLYDLRQDLAAVLKHAKMGSKILVEVPSIELFSGNTAEPFGEFSLEHIQFFSPQALTNLFFSFGFRLVAKQSLPVPELASGSVIAMFERTASFSGVAPVAYDPEDLHIMERYVGHCSERLQSTLKRVPPGDLIVYGAGSHSARLLPALESIAGVRLLGVVDKNPNLQGKRMGEQTIENPDAIAQYPNAAILVSSFRFQREIAQSLARHYANPVVTLY